MSNYNLSRLAFPLASEEQAGGITALINSVYRGENAKKGWTTEADILGGIRITEGRIRDAIAKDDSVIMLAADDKKIVGCVHLEKEEHSCWLGMLSVDVNYQTFGLGKILIGKSEKFAKEKFGCDEMKMKVIGVRSELLEYYFRRGYSLTGEREDFTAAKDAFGDPKTDNLYFEVLSKKL